VNTLKFGDNLHDLKLDEARANGTLFAVVSGMLIWHENGGTNEAQWADLKAAYDASQFAQKRVIDFLCGGPL
jgi:hypothetical protein